MKLENQNSTTKRESNEGPPQHVDWVLRGLAIAGFVLLVLAILAIVNARNGRNDATYEYDAGYVA